MRTPRAIAWAAAMTALLVVSAPAEARQLTVVDEPGDTIEPGLDITSVSFKNRDSAVVVDLTFTRDRRGGIIVAIDSRRSAVSRIISQHPVSGDDETFLIGPRDVVPCRRLSSEWNRAAATLRLRMPSHCYDGGDYGALRFWALIEGYRSRSSDVDYAPESPDGGLRFTDWVPRS